MPTTITNDLLNLILEICYGAKCQPSGASRDEALHQLASTIEDNLLSSFSTKHRPSTRRAAASFNERAELSESKEKFRQMKKAVEEAEHAVTTAENGKLTKHNKRNHYRLALNGLSDKAEQIVGRKRKSGSIDPGVDTDDSASD